LGGLPSRFPPVLGREEAVTVEVSRAALSDRLAGRTMVPMGLWRKPVPFPPGRESAVPDQDPRVGDQRRALDDTEYQGELLERSLRIASERAAFRSSAAKVLLIVLGALTATKAVGDDLVGAESAGVVLTYAIIGVATATVAGLLASFKWEEKAAQLTVLTTRTTSWRREMRLAYGALAGSSREEFITELQKLVAEANTELEGLELEAAKLGIRVEQPPTIAVQPEAAGELD
jgi:hypothetical protein